MQQVLNSEFLPHTIALFLSIFLTASAQLLLKVGASRGNTWLGGFFKPATILGFVLFGFVTVLMVYVMQVIEMKVVTAWTGITYLLVVAGSALILKERLSRTRVLGVTLIVAGIIVFHL